MSSIFRKDFRFTPVRKLVAFNQVQPSATQYSVTSGEITLSGVQTFFGDTGSISLGDLYRGGGIVPDITENSSVPASGEITLADMYGVYKNT